MAYITGPMKFSHLSEGPTLIFAVSSKSICLNWGHTDEATYTLESAEHFWPIHIVSSQHQGGQRGRYELTLVLERGSHTLEDGILHIGALMHEVPILSSRLTNDTRVRLVRALANVVANFLPKVSKDLCAPREM